MANIVIMPKQGLQMTEGLITKWLKAEGESIKEGEPFFEMETDKLSITIDSSFGGTVLKLLHEEGEEVPITEPIAVIGEPGEDISGLDLKIKEPADTAITVPQTGSAPAAEPENQNSVPVERPAETKLPDISSPAVNGRIFITPRAKIRAAERGIDYKKIKGTGTDGCIIETDVLNYTPSSEAARAAEILKYTVDITDAEKYAAELKAAGINLDIDGFIVKAIKLALRKYPAVKDIRLKSVVTSGASDYIPVIGADEDAILGASGIVEAAAVYKGAPAVRKVMNLNLVYDTETLGTEDALKIMNYIRDLLENPCLMMCI